MMTVLLSEIHLYLGLPFTELNDFAISRLATSEQPDSCSLMFAKKLTDLQLSRLYAVHNSCLLVSEAVSKIPSICQIQVDNPRLAFIKLANHFFTQSRESYISEHAVVHPSAKIGLNVTLEHGVTIGEKCVIEDDCHIMSNVTIESNVHCGRGTTIRSGSVIGQRGFGYARDEDGTPISFPHFGGVKIGNNCDIGALNTIASGTLEPTVVGDQVKTDDHVHIAHNVRIGDMTMIAAGAEISGSVTIGRRVWISPNASVLNKVTIGNQVLVGIGAVVMKDFSDRQLLLGNPARSVRNVEPGKDPV
jgi:UDP-3-O-[3-hydroxymyristoyl] glucosamine N-acyltransferase LpxD